MAPSLQVFRHRIQLFFALLPLRYRPSAAPTPILRELQRWHNRVVLQDWPTLARVLIFAAETVVWPFWSAKRAFRLSRKWGQPVRALTGLSQSRQFIHAFGYAQSHRLHPDDYYALNFWQHAGAPAEYLVNQRTLHLFRALNRGVDLSCLDDKQVFWAFCRAHHLATPPILLSFAEGKIEVPANADGLARNLFFKQRCGCRGEGAARWVYDAATGTYSHAASGMKLSKLELSEHYRRLSRRNPYIAQPCLADHPEVADIGNGTLSVIRMMTVMRPDGTIGEFASLFKTPTHRSILTNLADGALFSPIDSALGVLRPAFTDALGKPLHDHHPVTGVRVAGRPLPHWRQAVELACAAHRGLPHIAIIGWDVALTVDGPVLLEGNHGMALTPFNFPPNVPLGHTELPAILVWHLRRKYGSPAQAS